MNKSAISIRNDGVGVITFALLTIVFYNDRFERLCD